MQACPYDALYIDPETHTAAKCNYCAHRIDVGLEPACVNVCPEHAIISGDMEDPESEISQLLSRQQVKTRKPEKGTNPQLYYIDADDVSLIPSATDRSTTSFWGSQSLGVGHFAKEAEKMAYSNTDVLAEVERFNSTFEKKKEETAVKSIDVLMNKAKQTYNTPDKGILWGWEVSGYVWTKAISAGLMLVPLLAMISGWATVEVNSWVLGGILSLVFLAATGILLIMDLDQPKRFVYVLLRPHWTSWLVRGGYAISVFGGLVSLLIITQYFGFAHGSNIILALTGVFAIIVAIYTAFLFAQAKGRDFWQSPTLSIHMLLHSFLAGIAVYFFFTLLNLISSDWLNYLGYASIVVITANLFTLLIELGTTHPTTDAKSVVKMILKGRYRNGFWLGVILIGNILPLALLLVGGFNPVSGSAAGILMLLGIYINNHIWVEAPQRISLV
jgi:formate-dependent nitrite reductase membrane component NrfD